MPNSIFESETVTFHFINLIFFGILFPKRLFVLHFENKIQQNIQK